MGGIDKYALGGNGWFLPYNLLNEKLWYTWKETHFCMLCGVILHCQGVGDDSSVPSCWWESSNSGLSHGSSLDSRKKELLPVNKKEAHAPERQPIYRQIVDSLGMVVACLYSLAILWGNALIWKCWKEWRRIKILLFICLWRFFTSSWVIRKKKNWESWSLFQVLPRWR